jgi:hypothetical protein
MTQNGNAVPYLNIDYPFPHKKEEMTRTTKGNNHG